MRKNWFLKCVSIVLAGSMVLSMAACSDKGNGQQTENNEDAKKNVFAFDDIDLGLDQYMYSSIYNLELIDGRLYVFCRCNGENESKDLMISMNPDGTDQKKVDFVQPGESLEDTAIPEEGTEDAVNPEEIELTDGATDGFVTESVYCDKWKMGSDNTVLCVESVNKVNYSDPEFPAYKMEYNLVAYDLEFNEIWRTPLQQFVDEENGFYVQYLLVDSQGNSYLVADKLLLTFDKNGNNTGSTEMNLMNWPDTAFINENDELCISTWDEASSNRCVVKINTRTGEVAETIALPVTMNDGNIFRGGLGYDLLVVSSYGVYGYNLGDAAETPIMNFLNSDFGSGWLDYFVPIDEERFVAVYSEMDESNPRIALFTPVAPEDIQDKQTIVLGCHYLDNNVKKQVISFNKINKEYRIMVRDYSEFDTPDDWMAGMKQLNNDVLSGDIPDILVLTSDMPVASFINKGVLADLNEFIDADPEFNREDYLSNIMDLFSVDGKLYQLVPNFGIGTYVAKTKWVGNRDTMSFKEMQEIVAKMPEGASAFENVASRESVLSMALSNCSDLYMDVQSGKCNFDSPEFKEMLEYIKTLPDSGEFEGNTEWEELWNEYDAQWRKDKALLYNAPLSDVWEFHRMMVSAFGEEEYTIIGFPCAPLKGSTVNPYNTFAISEKSSCKEGAWSFVRYYLTDDYQKSIEWGFPLKESVLREKAMKATERPFYTNDDGEKVEFDDTIYVDNQEIVLQPMTEAEVEEVITFIKSVDRTWTYDQEIINIINEETAAFFAGQKSVDEVAQVIQSRVQVYVDENR